MAPLRPPHPSRPSRSTAAPVTAGAPVQPSRPPHPSGPGPLGRAPERGARRRALAVGCALVLVLLAGCSRRSGGDAGSADPPASAGSLPPGEASTVARVIDGDTIVVRRDGAEVRVRLIGIDTPETKKPGTPVQCYGPEASARTEALLPGGTPVRLVYDAEHQDRYGRDLAYVYREADGLFVNRALIADGFAALDTFPPNVAHVDELTAAARDARQAGRGLWAACPRGQPPDG